MVNWFVKRFFRIGSWLIANFKTGTRGQTLGELSQTVSERYQIQWSKPRLDETELAKKRFIESWSIPRLAEYFEMSPVTIQKRLAAFRKSGDLSKLKLKQVELGIVQGRLHEVFKGKNLCTN